MVDIHEQIRLIIICIDLQSVKLVFIKIERTYTVLEEISVGLFCQ